MTILPRLASMRCSFSLLIVALFIAGCGVAPTLIPPGGQPGALPTESPVPAVSPVAPATIAPSPDGATPAASASVPLSPSTTLATADDAVRLVQQAFPVLKSVQKKPSGSIGASTDIVVQERPGGWNITFWQGIGDCPAGCINNHYWYVAVEKTGALALAGEFVREFDAASNAVKTTGVPMWGVPRP